MSLSEFKSVKYETSADGKVAYIILNRPEHFNAIDRNLPREVSAAVRRANSDNDIHCIVVKGSGRGFCGGYDLRTYAQNADRGTTMGSQDTSKGYDPFEDYLMVKEETNYFAELFHSYKPTIAQVHGAAVGGGTDIALSCDLIIMADDAKIGYPPTRVWGSPATAMWAYRMGAEKAKRMLFTGDLINGKEAESLGLILKSVPGDQLEETVNLLTDRIKGIPINHLWMHKQVINGTIEGTLAASQRLGTIFDGITRNSPEGIAFQKMSEKQGFKAAILARDSPGKTEAYRARWKSSL